MMSDSLLGGKVCVRRLPQFDGPPGPGAPELKRLCLSQGELAQILESRQSIRYMAVIELRAGAVRGNHFHKSKEEFVYVITGRARMLCMDPATGERCEIAMAPGIIAWVATGVAHALATEEPGWAIEYSPGAFDAQDVYPQRLT